MLRFGLCCLFKNEAITFRTTTFKALATLPRDRQLIKLSEICLHNAHNLQRALETVHRLGIGAGGLAASGLIVGAAAGAAAAFAAEGAPSASTSETAATAGVVLIMIYRL